MKVRLLEVICFLVACGFGGNLFAQNDDCLNATNMPLINPIDCKFVSTVGATFDLAVGDCFPGINDINVWFEFTAQGQDLQVTVDGNGAPLHIAIFTFNPNPCEFSSANQIYCASGDDNQIIIDVVDELVVGQQYYIVASYGDSQEGTGELCINNPPDVPAPPNDLSCDAQSMNDDCVSEAGTTQYSTQDFSNVPGGCSPNAEVGVFYEFTLSTGNNAATIDVTNVQSGGDVTVILGTWTTDCNSNLNVIDIYCGPAGNTLLDVSGLMEGTTYVVYVATSKANESSFDLAVCGNGPPPGCSENDACSQSENIPNVVSNTSYTCVTGCNTGASPEPSLPGCNMATEEVVWFEFTTDNLATLGSVYINSTEIEAPTIQVFSGTCGNLTLTTDCVTGANFFAQVVNFNVNTNTTYYIAVSNSYGDGGNFELCVQTIDDPSSCVLSAEITVENTSLGSPASGPFKPAEEVEFCYRILNYTPIGNNCQWLQGIIPMFGCGWDPISFTANGMPANITTDIEYVYGGTWGWYTDVDYNNNTSTKSVGDFDGDGILDMCHYTEPNCPNVGITAGQIMPGGWYNWNPADGPPSGHPNIDYGDGNDCGSELPGPWVVCFVLTAKDIPDCEECTDAGVRFYTTSDGETGNWTGGPSICSQDIPQVFNGVVSCCVGPVLVDPLTETICSGATSSLELFSDSDPGVTYTWTAIPNSNIVGASDGSGKFITQTLENLTTIPQTQVYEVIPTSADGCPGLPQQVTIIVLPKIEVDAGPDIEGCAQGTFVLGGNPTASGGSGSYTYDWGNSAIDNVANPEASPNVTTTYVLTVTDENGCTATDDVTLMINPRFDVEISGDFELCQGPEAISFLTATPLGGTPDYTYEWSGTGAEGCGNSICQFSVVGNIPDFGTFPITVVVTDANGCTGDKTFDITVNPTPNIFIVANPAPAFCPGNTVDVTAVVFGNPNATFDIEWKTPNGILNGSNITVNEEGYYVVEAMDNFGCSNTDSIFIDEVPPPSTKIIGPDNVCPGEEVTLKLDTTWTEYLWDNGTTNDTLNVGPGTYNITVTNSGGCTGTAIYTVNPNPEPSLTIGGSKSFCVDGSTILNTNVDFSTYSWTDSTGVELSNADTVFIDSAGTYYIAIQDTNGCVAMDTVEISVKAFLEPSVQGDTSICPNACTDLNAGSGFKTYTWSNDSTSQSINVCEPGIYSLTVTDASGCTGWFDQTVTLNEVPVPTITSNTGVLAFCPEDQIILDAGGPYNGYVWSDTSTNQTLEVKEPGKYSVTVTDVEMCTGEVEVEVVEFVSPEPKFDGELFFCPGDSTVITPQDGFVQYDIDYNNDGVIDVTNTTNESYIVSNVGNSTIIVTDSNGCTGSVLVTVGEYTPPVPQISLDTARYCIGGSVSIGLTETFTLIEWSDPTGINAGSTQSIEANKEGVYTVVVTDANGCKGSTSIVVIEDSKLSPQISGYSSTCDNTPVVLDAGGGYEKYDWGPLGDMQTITVNQAGTYSVTVSNGSTCTGEASFDLTNSFTPNATVADSAFICNIIDGQKGAIIDFTSKVSGADGYWTDEDNVGVDLSNLMNVSFVNVPAGFYSFKYTTTTAIAPCENQEYIMVVEVSDCDCPNVEFVVPGPICTENASINLDDWKVTTEPGTWSITNGPGGSPLVGNVFNPSAALEGIYTIRFTLTVPKDNCDSYSELDLTVVAPANPGIPDATKIVCIGSGDIVQLTNLLQGEDTGGTWEEISTDGSTTGAFDASNAIFNTEKEKIGLYQFKYSVGDKAPCSDKAAIVSVQVVAIPTADAGSDQTIQCNTPEVVVGGTSTGVQLTYKWTELKGQQIDADTDPTIKVSKEGVYIVEVSDINACVDADTSIVDKNEDYPMLDVNETSISCFGAANGKIEISHSGGQGPFQYSIDDGASWSENTGYLDLKPGIYTVLIRDVNGCIDKQEITIVEPAQLSVDLGGDLVLVNETETSLKLTTNVDVNTLNTAIWTVNDSIKCTGANCLSYLLELELYEYNVCVEIKTESGCEAKDCITIRNSFVKDGYVPNVFSPNGDNVNDVFFVQGGKDIEEVTKMYIYDRWGELVFSNEKVKPNKPEEGWKGTFKNKVVNPGVYAYIVQLRFTDNTIMDFHGNVTVVK